MVIYECLNAYGCYHIAIQGEDNDETQGKAQEWIDDNSRGNDSIIDSIETNCVILI